LNFLIPLLYALLLLLSLHLYIRVAGKLNIVDKPNHRSSHKRVVVRGGGFIFPLGITLWFIWSGFQFPWFFTGLAVISAVSFIDDLRPVPYRVRLIVHVIAIVLLLLQLEQVPWPWWLWALVMFTAAGVINAFNFMDGINGITAGYGLSTLAALLIVNTWQVHFVPGDLILATAVAVLIFGIYNFRTRARCFAGDIGSVSLSFILVFLMVRLILATGNTVYRMFMALYGLDTSLTILHRISKKENIFEAHRSHFFQYLANEKEVPHVAVSSGYALLQMAINLLVILMAGRLSLPNQVLVSVIVLLSLIVVYQWVKKPGKV